MKNLIFALLFSLLLFPEARAQAVSAEQLAKSFGSQDEISEEIRSLTQEALVPPRGFDSDFDKLIWQIEAQLPNMQARLIDESLIASTRSKDQISIALNFPKLGLVLFDRPRWLKLSNQDMKRAIALHETLSLMGLEKTGVYFISNLFLAAKGLTTAQLAEALNGASGSTGALPASVVSCEWMSDRIYFLFELWSQSLERCTFNGHQREIQNGQLEAQLIAMTETSTRQCRANRKVLSVSAKVQTLIGTLKASAPPACTR